MRLTPDTILRRRSELILEVDSAHQVRVHHDHQILEFGQHALTLLDIFYEPRTVTAAMSLAGARAAGPRAMEELVTTMTQMVAGGILTTDAEASYTDRMFPHGGYGLAALNIAILDDPERKRTFIRAIEDVVTADDVVLDLGTGSGILALAAARAGARHVYAVEPARSGDLAAKLMADNGYSDRITCIKGWSTSLQLPEKATVVTTDIVGNEAFDMLIWEAYQDARSRLAAPGARLVPEAFQARIRLVDIPDAVVERHRVTSRHVVTWGDWYGFDFSSMHEADDQRTAGFYERPEEVSQWVRMSDDAAAFSADLHEDVNHFNNDIAVGTTRTGRVNGAVLSFDATLSPNVTLSTDPAHGTRRSHWFTACWAFARPVHVQAGESLALQYHYQGDGRSAVRLLHDGGAS